MGAMENAGCVTLRDEYLPRSRQDRRVLRVPRLGDPARDGAHVVRRPRDHAVVGRPLAQRVVRRVGLLPRRRRGHRVHRVLDRLHQRPQELGLPPGPAAQHPPDRRRQPRPAGGRGELRRHHLRQGRLGAQAARRLGRPGQLPRRHPAATSRTSRSPTPSSPTCWPRSRRPPAASSTRWAQEWLQTSGVNTLRAGVRARRRRQLHLVRGAPDRRRRLPDAAPAPARHRPVRRASTAAWCGVPPSRPTSRASSPRSPSWSASEQPDLLLLNDGDLAYAKIRLDERSLATVVGGLATARRLAGPGAVLGRGVGHDPRRRDVAPPTSSTLVLSGDRHRDRRVRRQPDPRLRRPGGQHLLRAGEPARAQSDVGAGAARARSTHAEPGSDHQLSFVRAYAAAAHSDEALDDARGAARRVGGARGPRRRHRPALDAADRARAGRPRRRRPDRRRSSRATTRSPARSRRPPPGPPGPPTEAKAEAWETGDRPRRRPQRDPAQRRPGLPAARRRTTCSRRTSSSYLAAADTLWEDKGTQRAVDRPGVHVPPAAGQPRSCSTGSTRGWRPPPPTRPPSATSTRAGPTSPAPSPPRPRTPRLSRAARFTGNQ